MSDGMSDSRAYDTDHEKWEEVDDIKFKKPVDVYFYHFRDGIQGECLLFNIEFFASRWGGVRIEGGASDGDDAIAFVPNDADKTAREAMKLCIKKQLTKKKYQTYLKEWEET